MSIPAIRRNLLTFILSLALIILSSNDMGSAGLVTFLCVFTYLIFLELHIIRSTLIDVYAEAITDSKFLHFFLKRRLINGLLTIVISAYFSVNLLLFTNLAHLDELVFIGLGGLIFMMITPSIVKPWIKPAPEKMFGRVAVISIFVILAIIIDGAYHVLLPADPRIKVPFDEDIPIYINDSIKHSVPYFQHILRSVTFLDMNIDSLELCGTSPEADFCQNFGQWFYIARFIFALSPTPYIAIALILLSIMNILRFTFDRDSK